MPNWAMNKLVVKGAPDALRAFLADNTIDEGFSFHGVVPMPSILGNTTSPSRTSGQLFQMVKREFPTFPDMPATSEVSEEGLVQAHAIIEAYRAQGGVSNWILNHASEIEGNWLAKQATGYPNWYDWAYANWGVKWDCKSAYIADTSIDDGELVVEFDTAWCHPDAWFRTVVAKYPHLAFTLDTGEPGCDFHVSFEGQDGEASLTLETDFRSMAEEFWGFELDEDENIAV